MSAIIGIYYRDGRPVERAILERMLACVAHRGPDGAGLWFAGPVGLGQHMLWTTPESCREQQPLANRSGEIVLVADARIDNRDEVMERLGLVPRPSAPISDGEVILAAYERWGERCPEYLVGDFAFALWDERHQALVCARDPLGVKPFYYYCSERLLVFGSEIKALFCVPEVPRRIDELGVAYYLTNTFEDREMTLYRQIARLPAAHTLELTSQGRSCRRYWSFDLTREVRLRSDAEYAEAFRELFTEAVRCRLRSAFPIGATLSGGLDSSSVVCMARKLLGAPTDQHLHTFSAIFPGLSVKERRKLDERPYIAAVLAGGGVTPHMLEADRLSPLAELDRVLWHQDEAINAPNLYLHWGLYGAAQQQGVRVFLDGLDGDTTVSHGWGYLAELAWRGRWRTLVAEAAALSQRYPASSLHGIIWNYGIRPLIPHQAVPVRELVLGRTRPAWFHETAINPVFAQSLGLARRVRALQHDSTRPTRTAREAHWQGLNAAIMPYTLELADRAAGAFALETRYPFFDRRLMEFCLALPPEQKLHQGWTRVVMRRAMAGILPPKVQWRIHKADLSPNFKRRLLECECRQIEQALFHEPHWIAPYVNLPALWAAYQRYASQPAHADQDAFTVYRAVVLSQWLRLSGIAV